MTDTNTAPAPFTHTLNIRGGHAAGGFELRFVWDGSVGRVHNSRCHDALKQGRVFQTIRHDGSDDVLVSLPIPAGESKRYCADFTLAELREAARIKVRVLRDDYSYGDAVAWA